MAFGACVYLGVIFKLSFYTWSFSLVPILIIYGHLLLLQKSSQVFHFLSVAEYGEVSNIILLTTRA